MLCYMPLKVFDQTTDSLNALNCIRADLAKRDVPLTKTETGR